MDITRYTKIAKISNHFKYLSKRPYIPELTLIDYKRGYVERYFIQKANDSASLIYEVNKNGFAKFSKNSFWVTTTLDWRITGEESEVKDSNFKSIKFSSESIPNLYLYLPNLLQFYKK